MSAPTKNAESLEIKTLVVVHAISERDWMAYPLADRDLAVAGTGEVRLGELELFLTEHLRDAPPDRLALFSFPDQTELQEYEVFLSRKDLPARLQRELPVSFACVVAPHQKDRWIMVLPLRQTLHISAGEDLKETVTKEIQRYVAAREPESFEFLRYFPDQGYRLEHLTLTIERHDTKSIAEGTVRRSTQAQLKREKDAVKTLESIGRRLGRRESIHPDRFVGRERELRELTSLLDSKERSGILVVGREASGKSALIRRWLRANRAKDTPSEIIATSAAELIAGMSGFGQWQERIKKVMEAAEILDAIIYFENFRALFSDRPDGLVDLPGAMKPFLDEGRVRVMGELTPESLDRLESRNTAFLGMFHKIRIEPLSRSDSEDVLSRRIRDHQRREPERPTLDPDAIPALFELTDRYLPYEEYPGKAVALLEAVRSATDIHSHPKDELLTATRLYEVFSLRTGIPPFLLRDDRRLDRDRVESTFRTRIIGQDSAVRSVVDSICVLKAELQPKGKPLATFLFIGPTGVGKTALAKTLAEFLFGHENRLVRFDMSEYQDPEAAERLIRGTDCEDGVLTRRIRQQPFSIVLLDEIEKAHSAVLDLLLQVMGEARLTDARGRTAFFHNAIIILTSNLGARHRDKQIGLADPQTPGESYYEREVRRVFRPELINRIDRLVPFGPLSPTESREVVRVALTRLKHRPGLSEASIRLSISDAAVEVLTRDGYSADYGARALRREIEDRVAAPLARLVGRAGSRARTADAFIATDEEGLPETAGVFAASEHKGLQMQLRARTRERFTPKQELHELEEISRLRRRLDRWLRLDRVEHGSERLRYLRAELARFVSPESERAEPKAGSRGPILSQMTAEYHRRSAAYDKAVRARNDLRSLEELALASILEQQPADTSLGSEALDAYRRFRKALLRILVADFDHRHQISLLLFQIDGPAFSLWLRPLIDEGEKRQWQFTFHICDGPRSKGTGWPTVKERRWGPPLNPEELWNIFETKDHRRILLRCRGPEAGAILTTEVGLHRYRDWEEGADKVHLHVKRVGFRTEFTNLDWKSSQLIPVSVHMDVLRRMPAVRELDGKERQLHLIDKRVSLPCDLGSYWANIEEIVLEHLLACEESDDLDMEALFADPWDGKDSTS